MEKTSIVHLLPCRIDYNGPAPVDSYFQVKKIDGDDTILTAQLRGRELKGRNIPLTSNKLCEGVCFGAKFCSSSGGHNHDNDLILANATDSELKAWMVEGKFESINIWQHDIVPDTQVIDDITDWFEIAKCVSSVTTMYT